MGRKKWKRESGYHRRSLAETTMFRVKCIFGGKLASRQVALTACIHKLLIILNAMMKNNQTWATLNN